jgi:hypothetical protein
MIIPNGVENGIASWTVRFYYYDPVRGYVADYVTVNAMLPGYNGNPVYAWPGADGSWWMPLVEKAYAEWNETGREGRDGQNAYASLTGGCMQDVDAQVLGSAATTYCPASDPASEQAVIAALNNNEAVTAAIFVNGDTTQFDQLALVSCHAYEVVGYEPTSGTFQLENPWGGYEPAPLTWSDICAYCGWFAVAETSPSATALSQAATSQATNAVDQAADAVELRVRAAALAEVCDQQYMPDTAAAENLPATQDTRVRATDMVLAEFGQEQNDPPRLT